MIKMPDDLLRDPIWVKKFDAQHRAESILSTIHVQKRKIQATEPDLADREALSHMFKVDPELYHRYRNAVIGEVL